MATEFEVNTVPEEQQYTNGETESDIEQTNIVYIDEDESDDNNEEDDNISRKFLWGLAFVLIGIVCTIIGFLWVIDPSPTHDCGETNTLNSDYRCKNADGHDESLHHDTTPNDINEFAVGLLIFGILSTIIGSWVCYKGTKESDHDDDD